MGKSVRKQVVGAERFDPEAIGLLPQPQRALLREWLKRDKTRTHVMKWDKLLEIAIALGGQRYVEVAESLAVSLADCGAASLERQQLAGGVWVNTFLAWRDYEALCACVDIVTSEVRRTAFEQAWNAAAGIQWERSELEEAFRLLPREHAATRDKKLHLLVKLNEWMGERKSGTRRDFSLFAREDTKGVTTGDFRWLGEIVDLDDCGIARHSPVLWLAGDVQLRIGERWLDVGAAGDFMALTPVTLSRITDARASATGYRLVENRTSFENAARRAGSLSSEIVIWLPGYASPWWCAAVGRLLDLLPMAGRISCDADPDGVHIALLAADEWMKRGLSWQPVQMGVAEADTAQHKRKLTNRDEHLAKRLLGYDNLPPELRELLQWNLEHRLKVEQENWL